MKNLYCITYNAHRVSNPGFRPGGDRYILADDIATAIALLDAQLRSRKLVLDSYTFDVVPYYEVETV